MEPRPVDQNTTVKDEQDLDSCGLDQILSDGSQEEEAASAAITNGCSASSNGEVKSEEAEAEALLVSESLLAEEAELREKNEARLEREERAAKAAAASDPDAELSEEERYGRLMTLLKQSTFYSTFLLEKMEKSDEAMKLKEKKLTDRKKIKEEREKKNGAAAAAAAKKASTPRRGGRKRKASTSEEDEDATAGDDKDASKKPKSEPGRTFDGQEMSDEQPLLLTGGVMRDYQIKGYQWMATLFENGINGILADEMGLGKTIQTIALFCHLVEMGVPGPFLIVAPLSTVPNWVKEFKRFAPLLPVVLYHGTKDEREMLRRQHLSKSVAIDGIEKKVKHVFVTSYEIAMNDRAFFRKVTWRYIVVDEGHRLKNRNCRLLKELKQYASVNRLLLTGTPLQNNLAELWSLLNFLMSEIFDDLRVFESWFDAKNMDKDADESKRIIRQEKQNNILSTLHQILTPFLLRRVKADVDLKIPPKKELLVYCPMTPKQRQMYEATVNKTIEDLMANKATADDDADDGEGLDKAAILKDDDSGGRTKRTKRAIDYSVFLREDCNNDKRLDEYIEKLQKMNDEEEEARRLKKQKVVEAKQKSTRTDAEVTVSLKNSLMSLRKVTNHPYLMEYPLTDDGLYYRSDQDMIDICGKLKVLDQMLEKLLRDKHKVLIFSQMTRMLDILGDYLTMQDFKFSRLDGTMDFVERQENIDRFNDDPSTQLFLLSTRAGGLGINLTSADTCIIYDSDWNPQQDLQAQDRCHRIGQTKPVVVFRLVTANTIDQRIVERAAAKRRLEKMIIHSKKFKSQDSEGLKRTMEAISPQELLELLNSKDHAGVVDRGQDDGAAVFTQKELNTLLDRSDLSRLHVRNCKAIDAKAKARQSGKKAKLDADDDKDKDVDDKSNDFFKVIDTEGLDAEKLQSIKPEAC